MPNRRRFVGAMPGTALLASAAFGLSSAAHAGAPSSSGVSAAAAGTVPGSPDFTSAGPYDIAVDIPYTGYLLTGGSATQLASARLKATQESGSYRILLEVESFLADLSYESKGDIDAQGLVPREFIEKRKVAFRSPRERRGRFRYTTDAALMGTERDGMLMVPPGTQDRLSLTLQMMALGRQDADLLRDGNDLSIPFASTHSLTESRWRVVGPEPVAADDKAAARPDAPQGYRIVRVADNDSTLDVSFWLAASDDHLPLVLQFSESGRILRFVHQS